MNNDKSTSILKFAVINAETLAGKIADERITLETLVSAGIDGQGRIELRWVDYPAKLADKVAIPIHRTPGFAYFASFQKLPAWDFQLVEGETEAVRHERLAEVAKILTRSLAKNGNQKKEVFDLHLVTPAKGMTTVSVKTTDNGKVQPLFTGREADQFRYPRLAPQGLFAAKGNQLVYFTSKANAMETKTEQARAVHTFPKTIDYLNRVHLAKKTVVATTADGMIHVMNVDDVFRTNQQAKISAQAEIGARFVGTPGGNGLEYSLEISQQGQDQVLTIWPKTAKHSQPIMSAAC